MTRDEALVQCKKLYDAHFVVYRNDTMDLTLSILPNGIVLRVGEWLYRIGEGYGPNDDGSYVVLRGNILGGDCDILP